MPDPNLSPAAKPRRRYQKPAVRAYGGLATLTRMATSMGKFLDGGTMVGMTRTGA